MEDGYTETIGSIIRKWVKVSDNEGYWIEHSIRANRDDINIGEYKMPAKCPICNLMMQDRYDTSSYTRYKCCNHCFIQFIEGREGRWIDGWRPEGEYLASYMKKRTKKQEHFDAFTKNNK